MSDIVRPSTERGNWVVTVSGRGCLDGIHRDHSECVFCMDVSAADAVAAATAVWEDVCCEDPDLDGDIIEGDIREVTIRRVTALKGTPP